MESLRISETVIKEENLTSSNNPKSEEVEKCKHVFNEDFSVATILVVAYLIETIVQIVLIVNCYRSLYLSATSSQNWLLILLIGWIVTSLLVMLLSIIWTFRGMDFSGRVCGQLLCYLMHLLLLGFMWRYLKIALAYEKADVVEFFKLRQLQIYIQTFPLLAIHLAYLINSTQSHDNTIGWMIAGELCSSIISLSLHPLLNLKSEPLDEAPSDHKHKPRLTSTAIEINVTIRILFLISRVIVVGLLVSITSYWPVLVIVAHLLMTLMWSYLTTHVFNAQANPSNTSMYKSDVESNEWMRSPTQVESNCIRCFLKPSSSSWGKNRPVIQRHVKNSLVSSYALFWDVNVYSSTDGSGKAWCLSLPVLLVLVENVAVLVFHLRQCQSTIFFVIISGTCLTFGVILFILLITWNKWDILSHSPNLKELPTIEQQNNHCDIRNFNNFLSNSVILKREHYPVNNYQNESYAAILGNLDPQRDYRIDEGVSNLGTRNITNTNNYERINETLMTAVKMHHGGNPNMNNENKMNPNKVHHTPDNKVIGDQPDPNLNYRPPQPANTLSSTSSRNTNTISISPEFEIRITDQPKYPIYHNSPLVIRKASKIQLNAPKHSESSLQSKFNPKMEDEDRSRCRCKSLDKYVLRSDNTVYEKLIEDAYGILICEGDSGIHGHHKSERIIKQDNAHSTSTTPFNKKLRVLCAKCLGNHDPLLSKCCLDQQQHNKNPFGNQRENCVRLNNVNNNRLAQNTQMLLCVPTPIDSPKMYSETTEYPTDTEFTCNLNDNEEDEGSISTHLSVAYVNLPTQYQTGGYFNNIFRSTTFQSAEVRKEFTGMEYVKAWLLMNDVETKNMLINRSNNQTNSLNRRNCNKISSKSIQISKSRLSSTTVNPYRKSQPVCVYHMKSPPMQKLHPNNYKNNSSSIKNECINKRASSNVNCKVYHNAPLTTVLDFNELQNDLMETVV